MSVLKIMRHVATFVGGVTLTLYVLGTLGIGHFHAYYGAERLVCTAMETAI